MKTIWPTDLDKFEYWKRSGGGNKRLLEILEPTKEPTQQMLVGTAFHDAMSRINSRDIDISYLQGTANNRKYFFSIDCPAPTMFAHQREHFVRYIMANGIVVRGRVDAITETMGAPIVTDYKTTFSKPAAEKYLDSWQWRMYLAAADCMACRYEIIWLQRFREFSYSAKEWAPITFYPYKGMHKELEDAASEFVTTACALGWQGR